MFTLIQPSIVHMLMMFLYLAHYMVHTTVAWNVGLEQQIIWTVDRTWIVLVDFSQISSKLWSDQWYLEWLLFDAALKEQSTLQKYFYICNALNSNQKFHINNHEITWYHRYREIIQITGGLPLRLHRKAGRSKLKCSDITSAIFILMQIIVSLER